MAGEGGNKPVLGWLTRKWRSLCAARHAARRASGEQNSYGGLLRLLDEVRALADAARRVCPPERRLQARIAAVNAEMRRLAELVDSPEFRRLDAERRRMLRRDLTCSREQLLRAMGQSPAPTRRLQ